MRYLLSFSRERYRPKRHKSFHVTDRKIGFVSGITSAFAEARMMVAKKPKANRVIVFMSFPFQTRLVFVRLLHSSPI